MAGNGAGVDDLALLRAGLEFLGRSLGAPKHALEVDLEDVLDFLGCHMGNRLHLGDAGIVHHDVESAELLLDIFDRGVDLRTIADVTCGGHRSSPLCIDFLGHDSKGFGIHVHDCNVRAIPGQTQSNAATNTLSGARNQRHFACDAHRLTFSEWVPS